jgi:hypothetical protein
MRSDSTAVPDSSTPLLHPACLNNPSTYRIPTSDATDILDVTNINVPDDLVHEIDLLAGASQRPASVVEVLWKEIRRTRQREALLASAGLWKSETHPELAKGGAAFVEVTRSEREERLESA